MRERKKYILYNMAKKGRGKKLALTSPIKSMRRESNCQEILLLFTLNSVVLRM